MATIKNLRRTRIKRAIRAKIAGTAERPRLSVYRSNSAVYAQLVDDLAGKTLFAATSYKKDKVNNNVEAAKTVGLAIAEKLKRRPPLTTFATRLMATTFSFNSPSLTFTGFACKCDISIS